MTTGDPGTDAEVTNSGDENNAIFDFVIPRGEPGGGGVPEVLATVDDTPQASTTGGALVFGQTPLVSSTAITQTAGSSDITIHRDGIYQVLFHSVVASDVGTPVPGTLQVRLYLDNTAVPGAVAGHTFSATAEEANMTFSAAFRVSSTPSTARILVSQGGYTFQELALTIVRVGDAG